jgi:hypothetical protein
MTPPAEPQRTLAGYKSKVHEQGEFDNPNDGKPALTEFDEYVLRLTAFPKVKTFQQIKQKKDGTQVAINVDKAICEFEDHNTRNIVTAMFRVDSLNFADDEAYESAILKFFRKMGHPIAEGIEPIWEELFVVGMRFRSRVVVGKGEDKKPNGRYYLDVPTVRPLLAADKDASAQPPKPSDAQNALANALFLAKGAKTHNEAMDMLTAAKAPKEVVMAMFTAHMDDKIKYPL